MPQDPDFPSDCVPDEWTICPDPKADGDAFTDCLDWIDGQQMTDLDAENDLTPFTIDAENDTITFGGSPIAFTRKSEGIGFSLAGDRTMEWGYTEGPTWHADRISFDSAPIVTVGPT